MRDPYSDGKLEKWLMKKTNSVFEDTSGQPMKYLKPYVGNLSNKLLTPRASTMGDIKIALKKLSKFGKLAEEI